MLYVATYEFCVTYHAQVVTLKVQLLGSIYIIKLSRLKFSVCNNFKHDVISMLERNCMYTIRWSSESCIYHITRDSQKVRRYTFDYSHLLYVFKFYFIFRKKCFHSLINANIKQITAVVPEKIDFEHAWGSRSGTRQI